MRLPCVGRAAPRKAGQASGPRFSAAGATAWPVVTDAPSAASAAPETVGQCGFCFCSPWFLPSGVGGCSKPVQMQLCTPWGILVGRCSQGLWRPAHPLSSPHCLCGSPVPAGSPRAAGSGPALGPRLSSSRSLQPGRGLCGNSGSAGPSSGSRPPASRPRVPAAPRRAGSTPHSASSEPARQVSPGLPACAVAKGGGGPRRDEGRTQWGCRSHVPLVRIVLVSGHRRTVLWPRSPRGRACKGQRGACSPGRAESPFIQMVYEVVPVAPCKRPGLPGPRAGHTCSAPSCPLGFY